jgi:hypothetical protein
MWGRNSPTSGAGTHPQSHLSLPKLRRRWAGPGAEHGSFPGRGLSAAAARAVLRNVVTRVAEQAGDEAGFFARLREAGVLVRAAVQPDQSGPGHLLRGGPAGHDGGDGEPCWYGGGRLSAELTLPRLRRGWVPARRGGTPRAVPVHYSGTERDLPARGAPGRHRSGAHPPVC